jgi:hypothetical protein
MSAIEVQMVSAPWCGRCQTLKPDIVNTATAAAATFTYLDYDELDDTDEAKMAVTALPMVRMRINGGPWKNYKPADIDKWRDDILAAVPLSTTNTDF